MARGTTGLGREAPAARAPPDTATHCLARLRRLRLSQDLPVLIEVVDSSDRIEKLLPILDEMVSEGLVTMEKVRVVKYSPGGG